MIGRLGIAWLSAWTLAQASDGKIDGLSMRFEKNIGQAEANTAYLAHGPGYLLSLTAAGASLHASGSVVSMNLLGADPLAKAAGIGSLPTRVNYLIGDDPEKWHIGVPCFERIAYRDVYPGVDLVYHGEEGQLEYDFILKPGVDIGRIRLRFEGMQDMHPLANEMILRTAQGEFRHRAPYVYQLRNGNRERVSARLSMHGSSDIGFEVSNYDRSRPLVVDPVITYSSYLGGAGNDSATSIAVDSDGNTYVAGYTESLDLLGRAGTKIGASRGVEVFVTKVTAGGSSAAYVTYLGGQGDDRGFGIAVDSAGSAVVTGWTYSANFPTANPSQPQLTGGRNGFVAKLSPAGSGLVFSTYLGGGGYDSCSGVVLDLNGNIYVAGTTNSADFPTTSNALQTRTEGGQDAFVVKYSPNGSRLYSTYLGGSADDNATAIAVDTGGNAYVTGSTYSGNFPVVNAMQPRIGGGQDIFVSKLNATGNALLYSTYIGGRGGTVGLPEVGTAIAVDSWGQAYVSGTTSSPDFPLANPLDSVLGGSQDAVLVKLSASGGALVYCTYLGGSSVDTATALAIDPSGTAYVTGYTASTDFPLVNAVQSRNAGAYDTFVAKVNALGSALAFSTYFGGNDSDAANGIALDSAGNIHLAGQTLSMDLPVLGAIQSYKLGAMSAFVAEIDFSYTLSGKVTLSGTGAGVGGVAVSLGGSANGLTTTDSAGNYAFPGLAIGGAFTVMPSLSGYTFSPTSQSVYNMSASQIVNFVAVQVVPGESNLSSGKTATQSSTLPGYATAGAAAAVDGNTDGNFFSGSVTHTSFDANAWWQVDLGSSSTINSIKIWNRTDGSANRLSDYWVFVSDSPFGSADTPATLQSRSGTWSSHQSTFPNPFVTILVGGTSARYVRIQLTGTNYLSLAEVQVLGMRANGPPAGSNLSFGKAATQSSTLPGYGTAAAGSAVDGSTDGNFFSGSVTHTSFDANAWWQVDLGSSATITAIQIWNRTDGSANRLNDYWVFISDNPLGPAETPATLQSRPGTWSGRQNTFPSPSTTIALAGAQGRYIRIQLAGTNYLSLAEVQVIGTLISTSPAGSNLSFGKAASQSSTFPGYPSAGAASAVDGNTDGNFASGSVTHTNFGTNAWWQVDFGPSATVSSIQIWNRTDGSASRLSDYWVFISDSSFSSADTPTTLQSRPGTWSSHQTTVPNPSTTIVVGGARGRYLRVQLTGSNYLSLAEVQVFGTLP